MTYRRRWLVGTIAVTLGVGLVGVALWIGRGDSPAVRSLLRLYADPDVLHAELRRWGVLAPLVFIGIQALQVVLAPILGELTASSGASSSGSGSASPTR